MAKRLFDAVGAAVALVLLAPLLLGLAVWIMLDSRGPVLYRQQRVGRFGLPFRIHKFRTMRPDADRQGPLLTVGEDARVTRAGRWLRHWRLDELPQLIDVLRGEMSLVGPRPEVPRYLERVPAALRDRVLAVRPGITGLSQIRYRKEFEHLVGDDFEAFYLNTLLPTKLVIDQYYVDHQSWLLDVKCLLWTAVALLRGGELQLSELADHVAFRPPRSGRVAQVSLTSVDDLSRAA